MQFHDQIEADIVINKQFSDIKDTKTLKVLSDKIKELEAFNNINKTLKVLFVSTWKSGGDLIGDVISQHPKSFYHYEPLAWHGIKRFTSETDESAQFVLESLFKCHYGTSLGKFLVY